jgi:hypothetical protein
MSSPSPWPSAGRTAAALVLVAAFTVVALAAAREASIGARESALADAAAARADWPEAIAHARAAAQALSPASPWPERGLRRLDAIGHDAEARGDVETAIFAYGAMRTAALSTSSSLGGVGGNAAHWRARADEGLARLAAR